MAPVIQIGGKKKKNSGLAMLAGGVATAFAVDYWLSSQKTEEELAAEQAGQEIAEDKKASDSLEQEDNVIQTIVEVPERGSEDEIQFSDHERKSEEEEDKALLDAPTKSDIVASDSLDFEDGELDGFVSPSPPVVEKKLESPVAEEIDEEEQPLVLPELGMSIWKVLLIVALAFLWQFGRNEITRVIPGLKEEFKAEMPKSMPMLGCTTEATTEGEVTRPTLVSTPEIEKPEPTTTSTTSADSVFDLFAPIAPKECSIPETMMTTSGKTEVATVEKPFGKPTITAGPLAELLLSDEGEDKWGIFAIIALALMIL